MRKERFGGLCMCLLVLSAFPARAATDASTVDRVRQTLLYGIDSQVKDSVESLRRSWDPVFIPELVSLLTENRSASLQSAVFQLFRDQSVKEGEAPAQAVLDAWQDAPSALAVDAVRYLATIRGAGLAARLVPIVDSPDNALAEAAIGALGNAGDSSSTTLLVSKLTSLDYPDGRKPEIILALGTLKDKAAVEALLAIAKNTDEERIRRLYAADALGKIGDLRALPVLRDMFAESQALVRQYAASALARFDLGEVFDSIIQGLRDEDAKVRESSATALGRQLTAAQASAAVPILSYKAELDPVSQVRVAAIKALGEIGGEASTQRLLAIYGASDRPLDSREAALVVLASKALPQSLGAIGKVIADEWKSYDTRTIESTAKVLSTTRSAQLRDILVRFLDSADPVVRSYGARGIAVNGFSDLKDKLLKMGDSDPNPGTRKESQLAAAKL